MRPPSEVSSNLLSWRLLFSHHNNASSRLSFETCNSLLQDSREAKLLDYSTPALQHYISRHSLQLGRVELDPHSALSHLPSPSPLAY